MRSRPWWRDLLAGENAARSLLLAGSVGLRAVNIFIVTTILPSVVADIGGLAYHNPVCGGFDRGFGRLGSCLRTARPAGRLSPGGGDLRARHSGLRHCPEHACAARWSLA
jgi:hypothetical protein